jgi:hypothetical protein
MPSIMKGRRQRTNRSKIVCEDHVGTYVFRFYANGAMAPGKMPKLADTSKLR